MRCVCQAERAIYARFESTKKKHTVDSISSAATEMVEIAHGVLDSINLARWRRFKCFIADCQATLHAHRPLECGHVAAAVLCTRRDRPQNDGRKHAAASVCALVFQTMKLDCILCVCV